MADVVTDVLQTPIFVVAAGADINLRRVSQLDKNVCYGCCNKMSICYMAATTSAAAVADVVAAV